MANLLKLLTSMTGLRSFGSFAPVPVVQPDHIIEVVCRDLQQGAIADSDHSVKLARGNVKDRSGLHSYRAEIVDIRPGDQVQFAVQNPQSLVLLLVVLEAQGFSLPNEQDLADVGGCFREDLFVSPRFFDSPSLA